MHVQQKRVQTVEELKAQADKMKAELEDKSSSSWYNGGRSNQRNQKCG